MRRRRRGTGGTEKDEPWVLRSSLQCGDQWRDRTDVSSEMVCMGSKGGEGNGVDVLQMRIFPSGKVLPVASRSGFQGHHAKA